MRFEVRDPDGVVRATMVSRDHQDNGGPTIPITVVSVEEAEQCDVVVCVFAGMEAEVFKRDNVYATCADCGRAITHRLHAPITPPKICIECFFQRAQSANAEQPQPTPTAAEERQSQKKKEGENKC